MSYKSSVLATAGLVGYWRLTETSGTNAVDETGTNNGTYVASPTLGQPGHTMDADAKSVTFNGTSQYVLCRTGTPIVGGLVNHTMTAWISGGSVAFVRALWSERPGAGNDLARLEINSGNGAICATYRDDAGTLNQPKGSLAISGGPHFAVQVKTGTAITWYVDGALDSSSATLTATDNFTNANIQSRIAGDAAGTFLSATLSEVAVFSRALSGAEIAALYTAGITPPPPVATGGHHAVGRSAWTVTRERPNDDDEEALALLRSRLPANWTIDNG